MSERCCRSRRNVRGAMMVQHEEHACRSISAKRSGLGPARFVAAWVGQPPVALVLKNLIQSIVARTIRFRRELRRPSSIGVLKSSRSGDASCREAIRDESPTATWAGPHREKGGEER